LLRLRLPAAVAAIMFASLLPAPARAVSASPLTCSPVVPVYGVDADGKLRWYGHRAGASGADSWAADSGKEIGHGWNTLTKVFSGGDGVIYAIDATGDLKWYRHLAPQTGERGWAPGERTVVGLAKPASYAALRAGDLLFWDGSTDDGTDIDHVGIYLGVDSEGRHRFVSSRKTPNGPTLGDVGGPSTLDGGTLYDRTWRKAKRL
jgi:hypothetical protein